MTVQIHHGDCRDVLATFAPDSIDTVICDPPYGLSFMGRSWDHAVPGPDYWEAALRVAKPGAALLAFGGPRTYHRLVCEIEDAGWEIRDCLMWAHGQGFPKSHNLEKAGAGAPFAGFGTALKPAFEPVIWAQKPDTNADVVTILENLSVLEARLCLLMSDASLAANSSWSSRSVRQLLDIARWSADERTSTRAGLFGGMDTSLSALALTSSLNTVQSWRRTWAELSSLGSTFITETASSMTIDWRTLKFSLSQITPASMLMAEMRQPGSAPRASTASVYFHAVAANIESTLALSALAHATGPELASLQDDPGLGLSPAWEPIVLAMKPLDGTFAENARAHGVAGLNIDGARIGCASAAAGRWPANVLLTHHEDCECAGTKRIAGRSSPGERRNGSHPITAAKGAENARVLRSPVDEDGLETVEAWNCVDGCPVRMLDERSGMLRKRGNVSPTRRAAATGFQTGTAGQESVSLGQGDSGGASRFFYCGKATKRERGKGNNWPTVKPLALMRWLCRLTKTPTGGLVLDPFMGSGSTLLAAHAEGREAIGIDRDAHAVEIARSRLQNCGALLQATS